MTVALVWTNPKPEQAPVWLIPNILFFICASYVTLMGLVWLFLGFKMLVWIYVIAFWLVFTFATNREHFKNIIL